MATDADTRISEVNKELVSKIEELDRAIALIGELTKKLRLSTSDLHDAKEALTSSDAQAAIRDAELKTSEEALIASDTALGMKSAELVQAIDTLTIANERLRHSRDLQNAFIRIAAHELKNPIQPLLAIAEYLEELDNAEVGTDKIEVSKSDIEMIVRNARRLDRLSNDILDVSRIEAHALKLNKEKFDLNKEIRDVVRDFQMHGKKSAAVQIAFKQSLSQDDTIMVNADKSRIYEVISNILINAIKFTESGSITIISAVGKNGIAIVRIRDTGQGIASEILPDLFKKFGVADASNSKSGSGLGLFISKGIVDAHGGKLWAENNSDGRGATFTFTIPAN